MTQQLKALTAHPEGPILISRTHNGQLTRLQLQLQGMEHPLMAFAGTHRHVAYTHRQRHVKRKKKGLKKEAGELYFCFVLQQKPNSKAHFHRLSKNIPTDCLLTSHLH